LWYDKSDVEKQITTPQSLLRFPEGLPMIRTANSTLSSALLALAILTATSVSTAGDRALSLIDSATTGNWILDLDWHDTHIATGGIQATVFEFDGTNLTQVASLIWGNTIYADAWHPTDPFLALAGDPNSGGKELQVAAFNDVTNTLTLLPAAGFDTSGPINVVSWSPDGAYLATGETDGSDGNEVRVFSFDGSTLTLVVSYDYGTYAFALAWRPDGNFLAVGGQSGSSGTDGNDLRVLSFDGSALTLIDSFDHDAPVYAADWDPSGAFVALGGGSGAGGIGVRVLGFDGTSLAAIAGFDHGSDIGSVEWRPDCNFLGISGSSSAGGPEVRILEFNQGLGALTEVDNATHGNLVNAIAWSPSGTALASGGEGLIPSGEELKIWDTGSVPVELSRFSID